MRAGTMGLWRRDHHLTVARFVGRLQDCVETSRGLPVA